MFLVTQDQSQDPSSSTIDGVSVSRGSRRPQLTAAAAAAATATRNRRDPLWRAGLRLVLPGTLLGLSYGCTAQRRTHLTTQKAPSVKQQFNQPTLTEVNCMLGTSRVASMRMSGYIPSSATFESPSHVESELRRKRNRTLMVWLWVLKFAIRLLPMSFGSC